VCWLGRFEHYLRVCLSAHGVANVASSSVSQEEALLSNTHTRSSADVFIIAATNRPDLVDPALLRPGRLDKLVYLGISESKEEQARVFQALTRKLPLSSSLDAAAIVTALPRNMTGADMYALCCEAVLTAIRRAVLAAESVPTPSAPTPSDSAAMEVPYRPGPASPPVLVQTADFLSALERTSPSVSVAELARYEDLRRTIAQQR
jgi:peroxin-6